MTAVESIRCVILGGGGHARVLLELVHAMDTVSAVGILDQEPVPGRIAGVPVLGDDGLLPDMHRRGVTHFAVGVGSVSDTGPRRVLFEKASAIGLEPVTLIHPRAWLANSVTIGAGCQILAGALVNCMACLGQNVIVNTGAIVEHDCRIGDHVHLATGAKLAGSVTVGAGTHVGVGASVLQGVQIGERAVIGAGAVVLHDVTPGITVVGAPARPIHRGKSNQAERKQG